MPMKRRHRLPNPHPPVNARHATAIGRKAPKAAAANGVAVVAVARATLKSPPASRVLPTHNHRLQAMTAMQTLHPQMAGRPLRLKAKNARAAHATAMAETAANEAIGASEATAPRATTLQPLAKPLPMRPHRVRLHPPKLRPPPATLPRSRVPHRLPP